MGMGMGMGVSMGGGVGSVMATLDKAQRPL